MEFENVTGTQGKFVYINIELDNGKQRTITITNFFNETTPQKLYLNFYRNTNDVFTALVGGNKTANQVVKYEDTLYINKIIKMYIGIQDSGNGNIINQANIKVSGRIRYE